MRIGIIGAGKVGTTMGKYIVDHGGTVSGFYTRTASNGLESAQFTHTKYFTTLDSLIEGSDTLFIATTDRAIKDVWDCITTKNVKGKVICHFSGSLSSDVFLIGKKRAPGSVLSIQSTRSVTNSLHIRI